MEINRCFLSLVVIIIIINYSLLLSHWSDPSSVTLELISHSSADENFEMVFLLLLINLCELTKRLLLVCFAFPGMYVHPYASTWMIDNCWRLKQVVVFVSLVWMNLVVIQYAFEFFPTSNDQISVHFRSLRMLSAIGQRSVNQKISKSLTWEGWSKID